MSEDGAGDTRLPARFRKVVTGNPPGRHRKLRRAPVSGVPAVLALGGLPPALTGHGPGRVPEQSHPSHAPPRMLLRSWCQLDPRRRHDHRDRWSA